MKQTLKYIYQILLDNQKFSESKHSLTLTLSSAVIVFSATFLSHNNLVVVSITSASMILSFVAMIYSFFALSAKKVVIKKSKKIRDNYSLMYFKDISKFSVEDYLHAIIKDYGFPKSYKPDSMDYDLAKQIISTSIVTDRKFKFFNYSITFMVIAIIFLVITVSLVGGLNA